MKKFIKVIIIILINSNLYALNIVKNGGQIRDNDIKFYCEFGKSRIDFFKDKIVIEKGSETISLKLKDQFKIISLDKQEYYENYYCGKSEDFWFLDVPSFKKIKYIDDNNRGFLEFFVENGKIEYNLLDIHCLKKSSNLENDLDKFDKIINQLNTRSSDKENVTKSSFILSYSSYLFDYMKDMVIDDFNNVYITGTISGSGCGYDYSKIVLRKFNLSGNGLSDLVFSTIIEDYNNSYYTKYISNSINLDKFGNIYITGSSNSQNYPITTGAYDILFNGGIDTIFTKFNNEGYIAYSSFLGGSQTDIGEEILITSNNLVYIFARTTSDNMITTQDAFDRSYNGNEDIFIAKFSLNETNSQDLIFASYIGGNYKDFPENSYIDEFDNIYLTGYTESFNFPVTLNAFQINKNGEYDAFFLKIKNENNEENIKYSSYFGGNGLDYGLCICSDNDNNLILSGSTKSIDLPTTENCYSNSATNVLQEIFIAKFALNKNGFDDLLYSTYLGGYRDDYPENMAIDKNNNIYITGFTESYEFPVTDDAFDSILGDSKKLESSDSFIIKFRTDGNSTKDLLYSTYLGGEYYDKGLSININKFNEIYILGNTQSYDFNLTNGCYSESYGYSFITKFSPNIILPTPTSELIIDSQILDEDYFYFLIIFLMTILFTSSFLKQRDGVASVR